MMSRIFLKMNKYFLLVCIIFLTKLLTANAIDWFGQPCESHQKCKGLRNTECMNGKCVCAPNRVDRFSCQGKLNTSCEIGHDCIGKDTGCFLYTCQKYDHFFTSLNAENVKIYRAQEPGARCEFEENCKDVDNSVCKLGKCRCKSGYWEDDPDKICRPVTNANCTSNNDCEEKGTKCLLNVCMLPTDFFIESNIVEASFYVAKELGDPCQTDNHCRNLKRSHCLNETCDCAYGSERYVNDETKVEKCWQVLGTFCKKNTDCKAIETAECFFNQCLTPDQFFVPSNANVNLFAATCIKDVCETDHHCRELGNSSCVKGQCTCNENFVQYSSNECRNPTDLLCSHNSNCKVHGSDFWCFSNVCQKESYFLESVDIKEYRTRNFGQYCKIQANCNFSHSFCSDHTHRCVCNTDYESRFDMCVQKEFTRCFSQWDCKFTHYSCIYGYCRSKENFFESLTPKAFDEFAAFTLYDVCSTDHHCRNLNHTYCSMGMCICLDGFQDPDGELKCKKPLVESCAKDSDCKTYGTRCFSNTCLKPSDFFNLTDEKVKFYAAEHLLSDCGTDYHCRNVNNTHCLRGGCNCLSGYDNRDGVCHKAINVTCSDDSHCVLPRSYCFNSTCLHPEDYFLFSGHDTSLYAAKHLDGYCQTQHHCHKIENSKCFQRKCICKHQYTRKDDKCILKSVPQE